MSLNLVKENALNNEKKTAVKSYKIAYIMSRFPKLTETFILYEMLMMQKLGAVVSVYPLLREKTEVMHPEARQFVDIANFQPFISPAIIWANLYYFAKMPFVYISTLWLLLRANWGSLNFFIGAIGIFPKSVYFAWHMQHDGVDHIHAHFASHPAAAGFIIQRLSGISYSFTAHGSDLLRDRHMLGEKVAESKFVAAISKYNRSIIVNECDGKYADKVVVLHCGVDENVFRQRERKESLAGDTSPFSILCVGTLHEVKGQVYLIDACKILKERGYEFVCHFIGDGPDRTLLESRVTGIGLSANIQFHGRLTRYEVADLLQTADILVAPSVPTSDGRREGIPVVLMEAMGSGVPVVASDLSGIPELVIDGATGLLTPPGDTASLVAALQRYMTDADFRRQMGLAGRDMVGRDFNLEKNTLELLRMIKEG